MNKKYVNIALVSLLFCTVHNSNGMTNNQHEKAKFARDLSNLKFYYDSAKERKRASNDRAILMTSGVFNFANSDSPQTAAMKIATKAAANYLRFPNKKNPVLKSTLANTAGNLISSFVIRSIMLSAQEHAEGYKSLKTIADRIPGKKTGTIVTDLSSSLAGEMLWGKLSRFLVNQGLLTEVSDDDNPEYNTE